MKSLSVAAFLVIFLSPCLFAQSAYRNIMISDEYSPDETTVVINPNNPNHIVVASNIDNCYFSFDGGYTWGTRKQSSKYGVWGDPCLVMDSKDNIFYFHLALADGFNYDRIVCQQSTNGGINWDALDTFVGLNAPHMQDKEWATVDISDGPFKDKLHLFWTQCGQGSYGTGDPDKPKQTDIMYSGSNDQGITWTQPVMIDKVPGSECSDAANTLLGVSTCTGPEGEVYTSWVSGNGMIFDRSTDGGASWLENDVTIDTLPAGFKYTITGIYRCFGFPSLVCDQSHSQYRGTLYVSWTDQRNGVDDADVWLSYSTNKGDSWQKPVRVSDAPPHTDQFVSAMAVDQTNGYLYFVYYDRRNYGDNQTDVYLARSTDGGMTFTNEKISDTPFYPEQSTFFGDYISIAAVDGIVRPVWTRLDYSKTSIWTAIINEK